MWRILAAAVAAGVAVVVTLVLLGDDGDDGERPPPRFDMPYVFLTYEVVPEDGEDVAQARERALDGIRRRLDDRGIGLAHVNVHPDRASSSQIRVELGGEDVPFDKVIELIERRATVGIHLVDDGNPVSQAMAAMAIAEKPRDVYPSFEEWSTADGSRRDELVWSEDRAALEAWLASRPASGQAPPGRRFALGLMDDESKNKKPKWRTYLIETTPIVDGADMVKASVQMDPNGMQPEVELELDADGRDRFAAATEAAIGRKLAIVLDGRVMSAPLVISRIPGGRIRVTMGGADPDAQRKDAFDLEAVLRSGSIPPLRQVDRRDVGPAR